MGRRVYHVGSGCAHGLGGTYYESDQVESGHSVYYRDGNPSGPFLAWGYLVSEWWIALVHGEFTNDYFSGAAADDPPEGTYTGHGLHAGETVQVSYLGELEEGVAAQPHAEEDPDEGPVPLEVETDPGPPPVVDPGPWPAAASPWLEMLEPEPVDEEPCEDLHDELPPLVPPHRHYADARGLYRIFNPPKYRIYRTGPFIGSWPPQGWGTPPSEGDTPWDTCDALPYTPSGTFADGMWYIAMSYFNGVLDSGFLPVGPNGEPYRELWISSGAQIGPDPMEPEWSIEPIAGGKVRVSALYMEAGLARADQWALQLKRNMEPGDPDHDPPITADIPAEGIAVWVYESNPFLAGTIYARLLVRRNDGTPETPVWVYSASRVKSCMNDTQAPQPPVANTVWSGPAPPKS